MYLKGTAPGNHHQMTGFPNLWKTHAMVRNASGGEKAGVYVEAETSLLVDEVVGRKSDRPS